MQSTSSNCSQVYATASLAHARLYGMALWRWYQIQRLDYYLWRFTARLWAWIPDWLGLALFISLLLMR